MIFVILGTQKFQLNRLLELMDEYVELGKINEEIYAQIGHSTYIPKHYKYERFLDKEKFDQTVEKADLIVTHSGVASIIVALNAKKPVIVYPRLSKYGEHIDNHQCEIADAFSEKNLVMCCYDDDDLYEKMIEARTHKFDTYVSHRSNIVNIIDNFLKEQ